MEAAAALVENKLAIAERLLRTFLKQHPSDVAALRMLAEVGARLGRLGDAEKLLSHALELAPGFDAARHNYAVILHREGKSADAVREADTLCHTMGRTRTIISLKAAALARLGEQERARDVYEVLVRDFPGAPKIWMSYGHTLKTLGKQDEGIGAYRKSIALMPQLGEAYWSLANLKTFRFTPADVAAMREQLLRADITDEDRFHLHFALAKALEDEGRYAESFDHYEKGNALRRLDIDYDADDMHAQVQRTMALFTGAFFAERAGWGDPAPDPIFIVGLPRSGSTLLEQILSSHSPGRRHDGAARYRRYGKAAGRQEAQERRRGVSRCPRRRSIATRPRELGREYLARTRVQRKTARPFFIDKMPNNWLHIGLHPSDPAQCEDHRRAAPSAGVLFLQFQTAFRPRPGLQLQPCRPWALLCGLRRADGAFRCGAAGARPPRRIRRRWSPSPNAKSAACSIIAASPSKTPACAFTKATGRCAPRRPNRCASRSTGTPSSTGGISSPGSGP